jgi:hypothetical protein
MVLARLCSKRCQKASGGHENSAVRKLPLGWLSSMMRWLGTDRLQGPTRLNVQQSGSMRQPLRGDIPTMKKPVL